MIGYLLEGLIRFDALAVQTADGDLVNAREFTDGGRRWWTARYHDDPQVSARTRRQRRGPAWCPVHVPAPPKTGHQRPRPT